MWLDDEIICCYFGHQISLANANRDFAKNFCFTLHFFKYSFPDLCSRKMIFFDMDVILIPVNVINSNWILVSVFQCKKTISLYDSMYCCGFEVLMKILQKFWKPLPERNRACPHRRWIEFERRNINTTALKRFWMLSVCLPNTKTHLPTKSLWLQPNANACNSALID